MNVVLKIHETHIVIIFFIFLIEINVQFLSVIRDSN